jgi:hypothetical protein
MPIAPQIAAPVCHPSLVMNAGQQRGTTTNIEDVATGAAGSSGNCSTFREPKECFIVSGGGNNQQKNA